MKVVGKRKERTIARPVFLSGRGLHTGEIVSIHLHPLKEKRGIFFSRKDVGEGQEQWLPARIEYVENTERSTSLRRGNFSIQTVEHLLSALSALQIDNLLIEVDGPEIPIADGSAAPFVRLLRQAGICQGKEELPIYSCSLPLSLSEGNTHLMALPSQSYQISYLLHYPNHRLLSSQCYSLEISESSFIDKIAPCRTFCTFEELDFLLQKNFIQGASWQNGVVICKDVILREKRGEEKCLPDEMVRHKILDLLGDLSLVPISFVAHIVSICSGHDTNVKFGKLLWEQFDSTFFQGIST